MFIGCCDNGTVTNRWQGNTARVVVTGLRAYTVKRVRIEYQHRVRVRIVRTYYDDGVARGRGSTSDTVRLPVVVRQLKPSALAPLLRKAGLDALLWHVGPRTQAPVLKRTAREYPAFPEHCGGSKKGYRGRGVSVRRVRWRCGCADADTRSCATPGTSGGLFAPSGDRACEGFVVRSGRLQTDTATEGRQEPP